MNCTSSNPSLRTCSSTSTVGPHTAVWQKAGVANSSAIGCPVRNASSRLTSCMPQGSERVHSFSYPNGAASVGVATACACSPGAGSWLESVSRTSTTTEPARPSSVTTTTSCRPAPGNSASTM
jgi:hypothetical protein